MIKNKKIKKIVTFFLAFNLTATVAYAQEDATIQTGDANAAANILNLVNTNFIGSSGYFALLNIFSELFGDLDLRSQEFSLDCQSQCNQYIGDLSLQNQNQATISNDVIVRAQTGDNFASGTDASISTGNANAAANILNIANTNIIGSNYLVLIFNNFSDWAGDIIFPSKYAMSTDCCLNASNITLENNNSLSLENNVESVASTDSNSGNGTSTITSGNANSASNVLNFANTNIFGSNSVMIAFRFFGDWTGDIFSAPEDVNWMDTGNGLVLMSSDGGLGVGGKGSLTASNTNMAAITNNVSVLALTGENEVKKSGQGNIRTGNANSVANVINVVNTNILGRNWVLGMVNIFGNWSGNIAFGQPDLWVGQSVSEVPDEVYPGKEFTYKITAMNNGDTDATNVRLSDDFKEKYLEAFDTGGGTAGDGKINWNLGTIKPKETKIVSYRVRVKENLPTGQTKIENHVRLNMRERDAREHDNSETTALVLNRNPLRGGVSFDLPIFEINQTHNASSTILAPGESIDFETVLKNKNGGLGYEGYVVDELYYDNMDEPIEVRQWDLGTIYGGEEIKINYTLNIAKNARPGVYWSRVKFRANDERQYQMYAANDETYFQVVAPPGTSDYLPWLYQFDFAKLQ